MQPEEFRRLSYEMAEAIAPGWERQRAFVEEVSAPVREWMLRELAPQPGEPLLELAAGAGDTGFQAAAVIGQSGRLISTDFSPAMVEVARRRSAELGLGNVEHRVMDAEHLELDSDSVDGVLCRFGYMLMADPAGALSETRRVLRPGGRVALAVWGAPERNPFFSVVAMLLVERGYMPAPGPGTPSPFSMASAERTRGLLKGAGFNAVRTEEVPVRFRVADIDQYMAITTDTAGPMAMALRGVSETQRQEAQGSARRGVRPLRRRIGLRAPRRCSRGGRQLRVFGKQADPDSGHHQGNELRRHRCPEARSGTPPPESAPVEYAALPHSASAAGVTQKRPAPLLFASQGRRQRG